MLSSWDLEFLLLPIMLNAIICESFSKVIIISLCVIMH